MRRADRQDLRRLPHPEEARHRRKEEEGEEACAAAAAAAQGRGGLGGRRRLVHQHQRRQRQEQRGAELHPVDPAGDDRQQLPRREAAQGRAAPVAVRQPRGGVLGKKARRPVPMDAHQKHTHTQRYTTVAYALLLHTIIYRCCRIDRATYISTVHSQPKNRSKQ
jgi:hypothetical protein